MDSVRLTHRAMNIQLIQGRIVQHGATVLSLAGVYDLHLSTPHVMLY